MEEEEEEEEEEESLQEKECIRIHRILWRESMQSKKKNEIYQWSSRGR